MYLYTGTRMRDLTVEQYDLLRKDQCSPDQERTYQVKFQETVQKTPWKKVEQHAHCHFCLVSNSTILLAWNVLYITSHHNKATDQACSPFKTMLRKIRDRYQSYCGTYKTHTMTTSHTGVGCTGEERVLDCHVEDTGNIDDN